MINSKRMARILAIDYGLKRCGIAVTDPLQMIASPLTMIVTHQLNKFLSEYLQKEDVETIVIGKPVDLRNQATEMTKEVERLGTRLQKAHQNINFQFQDERFTSKIAQQSMLMGGMKKKDRRNKGNVDKISATLILQSYLERNKI